MVRYTLTQAVAAAALTLALAACGGAEPLQGRGYQPPSEVTSSRAVSLIVPPGYGLRPDAESAEVVAGITVIDQQEPETLQISSLNTTLGEELLMTWAGVLEADPTIRATLNRENALLVGQPLFVEELLFGSYPAAGAIELEQGDEVVPEVLIETPDEPGWFEKAWESLGTS
ncbi:MAG: hypothetical protein CMM46_06280 [Rhodospirillaceae bacterium]|nr:hypothetical protein [Rhodospirillaceae bacterium]|tara:strand:- start:11461 stop:11976 length:516 start_codon:yes stop_codon:yes gene_type:complete